jgi:hypothetical protein
MVDFRAPMLFWALLASGQINMRKVDGIRLIKGQVDDRRPVEQYRAKAAEFRTLLTDIQRSPNETAQAIVKEGSKAVAAGMNPMDLKRGIDLAVEAVVEDLQKKLLTNIRRRLTTKANNRNARQGHHRSDQGRACGSAKRRVDRRASDHHGSHGGREAEEGRRDAGNAWWRHGRHGLLSPARNQKRGPGSFPGLFLAPQPKAGQCQKNTMASDDNKIKADPVQRMMLRPRSRALRMQLHPRPRVARKMPAHLPAIIEARARSRCLNPTRTTET